MIAFLLLYWKYIAVAALLAVACVSSFAYGFSTADQSWTLRYALAEAKAQNTARETEAAYRELERSAVEAAASRDAEYVASVKELRDENDDLRRRVDTGAVRLRVAAKCPAPGGVPNVSSAPGGGDAGGAELDASVRQDYFALREALGRMHETILALQAYARACHGLPDVNGDDGESEDDTE